MGHEIRDVQPLPVPDPPLRTDAELTGWKPTRAGGKAGFIIIVVAILLLAGFGVVLWAPWGGQPTGDPDGPVGGGGGAAPAKQPDASPAKTTDADAVKTKQREAGPPLFASTKGDAAADASDGGPVAGDGGEPPGNIDISTLVPEVGSGVLVVEGPRACSVRNGDEELGDLPLSRQMTPGRYELDVRCPRSVRRRLDVTITEGERTRESVRLRSGTLRVDVRPWADVFVNGRKVGRTPTTVTLQEGRHAVKLVNREIGKAKRRNVRIRPGQVTDLRVRLR
jgi:hypothetical protein